MSLLWIIAARQVSPAADDLHPNVDHYSSGGIGHLDGDESRSVVGMVPVSALIPLRQHNGVQPGFEYHDQPIIDSIAADIRSGKGITNPIQVFHDHETSTGTIGEGNHRLAAAVQEGITHVPVRVHGRYGAKRAQFMRGEGQAGDLVRETTWKGGLGENYDPPDMHPHHFPAFRLPS